MNVGAILYCDDDKRTLLDGFLLTELTNGDI